jgi:long-subunit fatty acid transport protein
MAFRAEDHRAVASFTVPILDRVVPKKEERTVTVAASATYALWSRYLDRHGDSPGRYGAAFLWKDTVSPTVGVRHEASGLREHLDVTYQPSPVPLQVGRSNYVDNDRVGVALGADYTFTAFGVKLRPGASLQAHRLVRRYQKKDDRLIADEVPDDAIDATTKQPIAGSTGLQTNNPGWPGFASVGWIYGGAVSIALLY